MELNEEDSVWARAAIEKTGLFAGCSADERAALYDGLEKQQYRPDATILFQGEISSRLCLVHTGAVVIIVRTGKEKQKVAELGAGSYFGEISLLTPRAATATVKAAAETEIIFLPGEVVRFPEDRMQAADGRHAQHADRRAPARSEKYLLR